METQETTKRTRRKAKPADSMPGPPAQFRGKVRGHGISITMTPVGWAAMEKLQDHATAKARAKGLLEGDKKVSRADVIEDALRKAASRL